MHLGSVLSCVLSSALAYVSTVCAVWAGLLPVASGDSEGVSQHCRLTVRDFSALFTVIPALQLQQSHAQGKYFIDLPELGSISITSQLSVKESKTKDILMHAQ